MNTNLQFAICNLHFGNDEPRPATPRRHCKLQIENCNLRIVNSSRWCGGSSYSLAGASSFQRRGGFNIRPAGFASPVNGRFQGSVPSQHLFPASEPWVQEMATKVGLDISGLRMVNLPRHPSQLYEAFFEGIVLWAILWFGCRKRKAFAGQMLAVYVMGYGFFRFLIEYVRQPDLGMEFPIQLVELTNPAIQFSPFNLTTGQILNFIMILIGVSVYLFYKSRAGRLREQQSAKAERPKGRKLRKKIR